MDYKKSFTIQFAGLRIVFHLPSAIRCPEAFVPFLSDEVSDAMDSETADAEYEIKLLKTPLQLAGLPVGSYGGMKVYPHKNGWLRVYTPLTAMDGCQVACLSGKGGKHILYYPASRWEHYAQEWNCLHLLGIEEVLIQRDALLLHSSVVQIHGQAVLFSGPSGIGKSTQAALWEQYLGAETLNGDRCIIRKKQNQFYGCGSPWCGTSAIYRQEQAPIKGIFLLGQSQENTIKQAGAAAFTRLFQQCIVNQWDCESVVKLTDLLAELLNRIPVYELNCRPDEDAVRLAYNTLFAYDTFVEGGF